MPSTPKSPKATYKRTSKKVIKDGVKRTVYRKDGKEYIRKLSSATGKYRYYAI